MIQQQPSRTIIQSKIDSQVFAVDKKLINSSTLLKNICDITEITEPILVNCSGQSLQVFISLINNYQTLSDNDNEHDVEFEKYLYSSATSNNKQKLIELIQDLCIFDSDFFLDSVADYILGIFSEKEKIDDWQDIQEYLGLENDFTVEERELLIQENEKLNYFLSIDTNNFQFPFANKNLYSLKTDFLTPMNVLIARIVQRSNEKISFLLSQINKTIKNEIDRHPIKLGDFMIWGKGSSFSAVRFKNSRDFRFSLDFNENEKYFTALKKRKIIVENAKANCEISQKFTSMDFFISKQAEILFHDLPEIYLFNINMCSIPSIVYLFNTFKETPIKFEVLFNQLIAKDFSKSVELHIYDMFKFFNYSYSLRFLKKANASKVMTLEIYGHNKIYSAFEEFIMNYMEDDGIIKSQTLISGISLEAFNAVRVNRFFVYPISILKQYMTNIVTK